MNMNFTLGQNVGIARTGSWDTMLEGLYTVTKVNKVRVELTITHTTGNGADRTRVFSVKTGRESGEYVSDRTYLMSEVDYNASVESKRIVRDREAAFAAVRNLTGAVGRSGISVADFAKLKEAVATLEQYAY